MGNTAGKGRRAPVTTTEPHVQQPIIPTPSMTPANPLTAIKKATPAHAKSTTPDYAALVLAQAEANTPPVSGISRLAWLRALAQQQSSSAKSEPSLAALYPSTDPLASTLIDSWVDWSVNLEGSDYPSLSTAWTLLNQHLGLRSFLVGYALSLADVVVWNACKSSPIFCRNLKCSIIANNWPHLSRWFQHVESLPLIATVLSAHSAAASNAAKTTNGPCSANGNRSSTPAKNQDVSGQAANLNIPLPHAEMGKVVTRFPPEPSGYLHIGHAKAALMNNYFARKYEGKLVIRFDDTNPSKEKEEYEQSIQEDLALIGIKGDVVSHTSDYFDQIYDLAVKVIKEGNAYVDNTAQEEMRAERFDGISSKCRDQSVEENLRRFEEMKIGTEFGLTCCLRAKIDMSDKNKAMRDPVIYRTNLLPHHRTGSKFKIYPTYDFACPIVDSLEGVTHALRSNEYHDRNPLYQWMQKTMALRQVNIWDFSRLNFVYTLLSKRKLLWFVEKGHVSGWDDPRFPTIRGIRRRGMTIQALSEYIISQGASQKEISLEWDKIWSINKRIIDPIVPRHTALVNPVSVEITGAADVTCPLVKEMPKHKKNPDVGTKKTVFSSSALVELEDAKTFTVGQEVTFMDWGNMIIEAIKKDENDVVSGLSVRFNPDGDFKKTVKVTWLAAPTPSLAMDPVPLTLLDYDYLISKKRLEEGDELEDFVTPVSEFKAQAIGDANLKTLKKGDMLQLERKGYYICDAAFGSPEAKDGIRLISIPDGRAAGTVSKAATAPTVAPKASAQKSTAPSKPIMYIAPSYYQEEFFMDTQNVKMYQSPSYYGKDGIKVEVGNPPAARVKPVSAAPPSSPATAGKDKKEAGSKKVAKPAAAAPDASETASPLSKLDIVVGKVLEVSKHPDADSLYVEKIDVGEAEPRTVVSGLVKFMKPEDIMGKTILVLKNLKPVAMRGVKSFAMVLCASNADHTVVEFLIPPPESVPGERVTFDGHQGEPEPVLNPKKKVWETVQPGFTTTDDLVAVWNGVPFKTAKGVVRTSTLVGASIK